MMRSHMVFGLAVAGVIGWLSATGADEKKDEQKKVVGVRLTGCLAAGDGDTFLLKKGVPFMSPREQLAPRPTRSVKDRQEQTSVSVPSASGARFPIRRASFFLAKPRHGITIRETAVRTMPIDALLRCRLPEQVTDRLNGHVGCKRKNLQGG